MRNLIRNLLRRPAMIVIVFKRVPVRHWHADSKNACGWERIRILPQPNDRKRFRQPGVRNQMPSCAANTASPDHARS